MAEHDNIRIRTLNKYKELNEQLRDFLKNILLFEKSSLNDRIESKSNDIGGISLLSIKNELLFQYLINLMAVMYRRATPNQSLNSSSTRSIILRLCEIRTFIEKIRPLEQKLKYQMDKSLKCNYEQNLNFRANPENFDDDNNGNTNDNTDNNQQEDDQQKPKVYRPPKLVPVEYNEDLDAKDGKERFNKRREFLERRAYHSGILEDFKNKFLDTPEEVYNTERSRLLQQSRAYKEKVAYEEEYLRRLPQTKRERLQLQQSLMNNDNDIMSHLQDADILFDDNRKDLAKKKKGKMSRRTKKRVEKKKTKSLKRLKSRK